jgi:hypothetical protein
MQVHATFYQQKPETRSSTASDVGAPMKSGKEQLLIDFGDSDSVIADDEKSVGAMPLDAEPDGYTGI